MSINRLIILTNYSKHATFSSHISAKNVTHHATQGENHVVYVSASTA